MIQTKKDDILFGPSGNSASFYAEGNKGTIQTAAWLSARGLTAFEYSFGRGVNMREETARAIGAEMSKYNITISCHAPYYINLAGGDESVVNSTRYLEQSIIAINRLGGNRVIFHSGTQGKNDRELVNGLLKDRFLQLAEYFDSKDYDYILCPETMGRASQMGTYREIIDICALSPRFVPCFDFGHINCLVRGGLRTADDYRPIFDYAIERLGLEKASRVHIHFSKIMYGEKGEIKHLDFSDTFYGPEFDPLAEALLIYKLSPVIICESADNMAEDALAMQKIYFQKQS